MKKTTITFLKLLEGQVTRLIVSRSPADSPTDVVSHHTGFEKEQKSKGIDFSCMIILFTKVSYV